MDLQIKNIQYIHDNIELCGENLKEISYFFNFLISEYYLMNEPDLKNNIDLTTTLFKEIVDFYYIGNDKNERYPGDLFSIKINDLTIHIVKENNRLIYKIKRLSLLKETFVQKTIKKDVFHFNDTDKMNDILLKCFQLLNEQKGMKKHPDKLTSIILNKLGLPQNYIPSYLTLYVEEKNLNLLTINRQKGGWYDNEFRLIMSMNQYHISIKGFGDLCIVKQSIKQFGSIEYVKCLDEFLKDHNMSNYVKTDFDIIYLLNKKENIFLKEGNHYTIDVFETIFK